MRKDPQAIKSGTEEQQADMELKLRAASEDGVNKRLQGRENPKTGRQRDPRGGYEDVDRVRGEATFIQRASRMKRKRQKRAKAGESERGGGVGRETEKLAVWRKNKCGRSGHGTTRKETKAELRSRC